MAEFNLKNIQNTVTVIGEIENISFFGWEVDPANPLDKRGYQKFPGIGARIDVKVEDDNIVKISSMASTHTHPKDSEGKNPKANPTYALLKRLEEAGEGAIGQRIGLTRASLRPSVFKNDETVITSANIDGGFLTGEPKGQPIGTFRNTMQVTDVQPEYDKDENPTGSLIVKGFGFTYNMAQAVPLRLFLDNPQGVQQLQHLWDKKSDPEHGLMIDLWGRFINTQVAPKVEQSGWGESYEVTNTSVQVRRVIVGAKLNELDLIDFDDDLVEKIKKSKENLDTFVSTELARLEAQAFKKNNQPSKTQGQGGSSVKAGDFNF